ncbi:hypothetical protein Q0N12_17775 [Rossellomorea marisflavi]|uniref:hypothetical protein n=1 Tax=Rossellomorea marisflavi TaxID=189381 RepID=UPI0034577172
MSVMQEHEWSFTSIDHMLDPYHGVPVITLVLLLQSRLSMSQSIDSIVCAEPLLLMTFYKVRKLV